VGSPIRERRVISGFEYQEVMMMIGGVTTRNPLFLKG
jgi:hypothetical protein